jgi:hypothetical protein
MNIINFQQKSCLMIGALLDFYLNDELLVETTHDVLIHLESCADCGKHLRYRRHLKAALKRAAIQQEAPTGLDDRIRRSIRSDLCYFHMRAAIDISSRQ